VPNVASAASIVPIAAFIHTNCCHLLLLPFICNVLLWRKFSWNDAYLYFPNRPDALDFLMQRTLNQGAGHAYSRTHD
jgi:hypothetical protein